MAPRPTHRSFRTAYTGTSDLFRACPLASTAVGLDYHSVARCD